VHWYRVTRISSVLDFLTRSRLPGTDRSLRVWITSGLPTIGEVTAKISKLKKRRIVLSDGREWPFALWTVARTQKRYDLPTSVQFVTVTSSRSFAVRIFPFASCTWTRKGLPVRLSRT
jgi:hypothetical protein